MSDNTATRFGSDESDRVLRDIRNAIAANSNFSGVFEPVAEDVRYENGFWFVPVRMLGKYEIDRRFELYARFADLEAHLRFAHNLNVLLKPIFPDFVLKGA